MWSSPLSLLRVLFSLSLIIFCSLSAFVLCTSPPPFVEGVLATALCSPKSNAAHFCFSSFSRTREKSVFVSSFSILASPFATFRSLSLKASSEKFPNIPSNSVSFSPSFTPSQSEPPFSPCASFAFLFICFFSCAGSGEVGGLGKLVQTSAALRSVM